MNLWPTQTNRQIACKPHFQSMHQGAEHVVSFWGMGGDWRPLLESVWQLRDPRTNTSQAHITDKPHTFNPSANASPAPLVLPQWGGCWSETDTTCENLAAPPPHPEESA